MYGMHGMYGGGGRPTRPSRPSRRPQILLFSYAGSRTPHHTNFAAHFGMPVLDVLDVGRCQAPPRHICQTMNGLDPECRRHVFRDPRTLQITQGGRRMLEEAVRCGAGAVAMGATCGSGTHRSVSVIEELAKAMRNRGYEVRVEHLDIIFPGERGGRRPRYY